MKKDMIYKKRYAVGITLYYPDEEQIKYIRQYRDVFNKCYVFDNTDEGNAVCAKIKDISEVAYFADGCNRGLPVAFNYMMQRAIEDNMDYLCLMDQDSDFENKGICKIMDFLDKLPMKNNIGIIAPFVFYGHNTDLSKKRITREKYVITSGSFLNLKLMREKGIYYDEAYFVDRCDTDVCMQLRQKGIDVLMYHDAILQQSLGENNSHKHSTHNTTRHYYMFRDRLYYNKKYYHGGKRVLITILQIIRHCLLIICYEDKKREKLKISTKAYYDYKRKWYGKESG